MPDIHDIRRTLRRHGQDHLLRGYEALPAGAQDALLEQIAAIDFEQLDGLIERYVRRAPAAEIPGDILPVDVVPARPAAEQTAAEREEAGRRGLELIASGKVAAFVVAGGQGTRLGYEGPKGCLEATPVAHKPLFQVFAEQLLAAGRRGGRAIPWYVLTSPDNDVVTQAFFRQHNWFGLSGDDVRFVVQGMMPAIGLDGKLLLAGPGRLAMSPNGHGGSLPALRDRGALEDMARRGVEYISYFQVDNPLVRCVDPVFIGLHAGRQAEMSAKCLPKRHPMEKLGNFCLVDGRPTVIEYSDLPEDLARATTDDGRLQFSAGSIAIHVLSRSFVERITAGGRCELPLHRAEKTVPFLDDAGRVVEPDEPNAVKLEMFVFDALPLAERAVILETIRSEEFSPIKNAEGEDSLATSLHDQVRRAAAWLEAAGVAVPRDADGQIAAAIEISPLFADSAEALAEKVDPALSIAAGAQVYLGSRGQTGTLK
jgi:UDP-N-acetylglucosamine/UDP-N-acetylgalactosamine diphosphorylase